MFPNSFFMFYFEFLMDNLRLGLFVVICFSVFLTKSEYNHWIRNTGYRQDWGQPLTRFWLKISEIHYNRTGENLQQKLTFKLKALNSQSSQLCIPPAQLWMYIGPGEIMSVVKETWKCCFWHGLQNPSRESS